MSRAAGEVRITIGFDESLEAVIDTPPDAKGLIIFAHGSGSGRRSPRNQAVAAALNREGFATLLADLLTKNEQRVDEETLRLRFNIGLLTQRVERVVDWAAGNLSLPIGLFGASTGAAAALDAAASRPEEVRAVVSRGGRPDLARRLDRVIAPTLLIVGGNDTDVLRLNQRAFEVLKCRKALQVVPGATHLFEERGTLERASALTGEWFAAHVQRAIVHV